MRQSQRGMESEGNGESQRGMEKGNVRVCSTNEAKKGEIGKMFLRWMFDVCALSETKPKGKGEVMFGEVEGRVSGITVDRAREGVALLLSGRLMRCVVEWKEVSSKLMWIRVKIERVWCLYRHTDQVVRRARRRYKSSGMS